MIKKLFILSFLTVCLSGTLAAQTYPSSSWVDFTDTSWYNADQDTFNIASAEELAGLSELVGNGEDFQGKTINITADINLDGHLWEPIGFDTDMPFSGTVMGNDHVISNLWITGLERDFLGLFGQSVGASFSDINLDTAHIDDIGDSSGALVANMFTNCSMDNCHAYNIDMTVLGANIGGLNGSILTDSSIENSSFQGSVTGINQVGGLTGQVWDNSTLRNSYVEGSVQGDYIVGGLVGFATMTFGANRESTVENCYSRADVTGTDPFGAIGGIYGYAQSSLIINNVYATGSVTGLGPIGGFAGKIGSIVVENNYFDTETSGLEDAIGEGGSPDLDIQGKTSAEMTIQDFAGTLNQEDPEGPWAFDPEINDGYPYLGDNILGTQDFAEESFEVMLYPTKVDQEFYIRSKAELNAYKIYSITGSLAGQGQLNGQERNTIQAGTLSPGTYIVQIQSSTTKVAKRIIKK